MVDAILSFAVENLLNVAKGEAVKLASLKKNLEDLSNELMMIKAVIQDAEMKQVKDETIRIWLQNLKYAAYDIEDMLEDWDQVRNSSSRFSSAMHLIRQSKFAHKVISMKEKLREISVQKDTYRFREISVRETDNERQTSSFVEQSNIIGRDGDKELLIRKLVESDESWREGTIPAISIVGMGGLGKTTLAQVVFNTKTVKDHFEKCIWVCVSNDFNTKDIMINIVKNGGGTIRNFGDDQVELIRQEVLKIIENKKYLLVLDDVWNENQLLWEPLHDVLNSGTCESRIIVTTRNRRVADAVRSEYIHDLVFLPKEDCWSIFEKNVFPKNSDHDQGHNDLHEIGKQIVEKCGGIPLAVKTIASAIRKKARGRNPTKEQLNDILSNEIWEVSMDSDIDILPGLMLSYIEFPSALKNCFCYCSLFPKDYIFQKDLLTKLWVAQGYINAKDGQIGEVEHKAEECFFELLDRSLFQEPVSDKYGMVKSCKMHDLVHDLAQWVTKSEFCTMKEKQSGQKALKLGDARHCSVHETLQWKRDISLAGSEKLRSLLYFKDGSDPRYTSPSSIYRFKQFCLQRGLISEYSRAETLAGLGRLVHLRCLDLSYTQINSLPSSIGKLKLLRYLDLKFTEINELPGSITSLSRLQTLILGYCSFLKKLPDRIPEMGSLRHLDVSGCSDLEKLPDEIGRLTLLQTLGIFPVTVGRRGCSNIGELGRLNHLRQLEAVVSKNEALTAKLRDKTSLGSLRLRWQRSDQDGVTDYIGVLEGLHPPPSLMELDIWSYPGDTFPRWMGDATSFLHLREVKLVSCEHCTLLPPLGRLPCLIKLNIRGLSKVETVGDEFLFGVVGETGANSSMVAFPKLETLKIRRMIGWESWTTSLTPMVKKASTSEASPTCIMPRLSELLLDYCPKLKEVATIFTHNLQKLTIESCSDTLMKCCELGGDLWPFISHIPYIKLWPTPNPKG